MNVYMDYEDYCKAMGSGLVFLAVLGVIGFIIIKIDEYLSK